MNLFETKLDEDLAGRVLAPDVGTIIQVDDPNQWSDKGGDVRGKRRYRVNGWMKGLPEPKYDLNTDEGMDAWIDHQLAKSQGIDDGLDDILFASARRFNDGKRLVSCTREEAEYLSCSGVAGAIIKVQDAEVIGRVNWPEEQIADARAAAMRRVGQILH